VVGAIVQIRFNHWQLGNSVLTMHAKKSNWNVKFQALVAAHIEPPLTSHPTLDEH